MATKRPADLIKKPDKRMADTIAEEEYEGAEDDLYFHAPSGTWRTYHEGDENDEDSGWFNNPPTFKVGSTTFSVTEFNGEVDAQPSATKKRRAAVRKVTDTQNPTVNRKK
jgi:hypothetical protein